MLRLRHASTSDRISAVFLLGLILMVLAFREHLTDWPLLLARYLGLLALQMAVVAARRSRLPAFLAAFFPLVPVLGIYDSLDFIPELNPTDRDGVLIRIDRALLGGDPSLWLERLSAPWLTEVLQLAYLVYYVLPLVLLGLLHRGRPRTPNDPHRTGSHEQAFDLCMVALLLSHYLSFTGYIAVPALGPRFALGPLYRTELAGLLTAEPIRNLLNALEGIKRDAFPSGHTAAALISLHYAFRFMPRLARYALPAVALMILSTLYLRYHYGADILAGALLAPLCVLLAPRLLRHGAARAG
ncbi:MAG: phosphatase PAP2 family protein [candidate division NC10 bacterium]|nr:phosphatase PAP2 family protein [candidate division NC10 bacterium]